MRNVIHMIFIARLYLRENKKKQREEKYDAVIFRREKKHVCAPREKSARQSCDCKR